MDKDQLIKSTMAAFFAMMTSNNLMAADTDASATSFEKCYGIARAGMNDCSTATSSCASSSTKDGQADAFILLPKGFCERIVGGKLSIEPVKPSKEKS